jgi:hypothetical protein
MPAYIIALVIVVLHLLAAAERAGRRGGRARRHGRGLTTLLVAILTTTMTETAPIQKDDQQVDQPGLTEASRTFSAYDCSKPDQIEAVVPEQSTVCGMTAEALEQKETAYKVLQKATFTRVDAIRCKEIRTTMTLYCGTYSHQTYVPQLSNIQIPKKVQVGACRRHWDTETYTVRHEGFRLKRDGTEIFKYNSVGHTQFTTTDVTCRGAMLVDPHTSSERHSIVQHEQVTFTMEKVKILVDENDVVVTHHDQLRLSCLYSSGGCISASGTYQWHQVPAKARCAYQDRKSVV